MKDDLSDDRGPCGHRLLRRGDDPTGEVGQGVPDEIGGEEMVEYISRDELLKLYVDGKYDTAEYHVSVPVIIQNIKDIPAADVLPRDEAIKMGAELAAMHGSDATSQQLEEVYLKGVEYGMTRRDVRPVVTCGKCKYGKYTGIEWFCDKHSGHADKFGEDASHSEYHSEYWFCADGVKKEG